ncbi:phosphotransferase [Saxibacter everestensis]|uniref:Phosphotransferase n=1 Tax=Saxibacter everestensis TaxID=2909229 RepID=A0ABY8QWS5_9MICO|nr:phosphotransferase [Brevibacteriaceae bacterium ZFBP1038]
MNPADSRLLVADPDLPALRPVLDPEVLCALVGYPAVVSRIRYKPGTSIVAKLSHDAGGADDWIAGYAPHALAKLEKLGDGARVLQLPDGPGYAAVGPLRADRALHRPLRRLESDWQLVRYNPNRRAVLRVESRFGQLAVKVTRPSQQADAAVTSHLSASHDWVLPPVAGYAGADHGVTATSWWGKANLADLPETKTAETAGRALAAIHGGAAPDWLPLRQPSRLSHRLHNQLKAIKHILPDSLGAATASLGRISGRISELPQSTGLVHGDFSADQVLVDDAEVRFVDFDRAMAGPQLMDLGSFAAAAILDDQEFLTAGLLEGYAAGGGGTSFRMDDLAAWTAFGVALRLLEPFRDRESGWDEQLRHRLDLIDGLL